MLDQDSLKIPVYVVAAHILVILIAVWTGCSCRRGKVPTEQDATDKTEQQVAETKPEKPDYSPVRAFPDKFPRKSHMPDIREAEASGSISNSLFSPGRDLVYVDDKRVWWESDNDGEDDSECDHSMHKSAELPFRRLVELVCASNATLRVQEAYRPATIHSSLSLHKEGRALDLTCPGLDPRNPSTDKPSRESLEILAKLAWAAGFDWVYYEVPQGTGNGAHIHASVKR